MESRVASHTQSEDSLSGVATMPRQDEEWIPAANWLSMFVPIVLKGIDGAGHSFIEHCQTHLISKRGLKTKSMQSLAVGGRLQIAVPSRQRVSWATITWLGEKKTDGQEIGVAVEQNDDFWGVQFPTNRLDLNFIQPAIEQENTMIAAESSDSAVPDTAPSIVSGAVPDAVNEAPRQLVESLVQSGPRDAQPGSSDKLSGVLRELAESAISETLQEALKTLVERADEIRSKANNDFAALLHRHVEQVLSVAMERMEISAAELASQQRQDWEQNLQSLCNSAEERLRAQLAEQSKWLAAESEGVRNSLAQKLADASDVLKESHMTRI